MAQRKLREAESMISDHRESLRQLRLQLRDAHAAAAKAAASSSATPSAGAGSPGSGGGGTSRALLTPRVEPLLSADELAKFHAEHALHLVVGSSDKRSQRLVALFPPPVGP